MIHMLSVWRGASHCVDEFTLYGRRLPVPAICQANRSFRARQWIGQCRELTRIDVKPGLPYGQQRRAIALKQQSPGRDERAAFYESHRWRDMVLGEECSEMVARRRAFPGHDPVESGEFRNIGQITREQGMTAAHHDRQWVVEQRLLDDLVRRTRQPERTDDEVDSAVQQCMQELIV